MSIFVSILLVLLELSGSLAPKVVENVDKKTLQVVDQRLMQCNRGAEDTKLCTIK